VAEKEAIARTLWVNGRLNRRVIAKDAEVLRREMALPEAAAAAPALLVGFADQFLPVILGQSIESDLTRFVIACAAVTQLVYMSEVGAYLLKSKLSVSLPELFVVFLLRTLITVPICALFAHMIF